MNIAFRTDSSYTIGTGHIHRCLNIARKFKKKKSKCFFFVNDYPGNINKIIQKEFALFNLSTNYSQYSYSHKSNIYDANLTVKLIKKLNIDLLFIDNYLIQEKWEEKVSKFCKIVFISDYLDRKSHCNFYINYNVPYENISTSKNLNQTCKKLIGTDYTIIKKLPNLKKKSLKKKIVVFMGGVDTNNFTKKIISILSDRVFIDFEKVIIIGIRNKNKQSIFKQVKNLKNFNILNGDKKNLYDTFSNSTLIITGASTSMYEHLALGLNSIVIAQNKLQNKILNKLSELNLINFIKYKNKISKNYINSVLKKEKRTQDVKILKNLFDSKGVNRIVEYFLNKNILKDAKLRKVVNEDRYFLFRLVNDPEVIRNSLLKKTINFKEHNLWFNKALKNKNIRIFIFKNDNHKFGHVRFNKITKNKTIITYSVANEFRGKNVGYRMLKLAIEKNIFKTPLYAVVNKDNIASNKIFKKLGFSLQVNEHKHGFFYYFKNNKI